MASTRKMAVILTVAFALSCLVSTARGGVTTTSDVLKVDIFDNANITGFPDAAVYIINGGESASNLCANIYVFNNVEEMIECCSCTSSFRVGTTTGNGFRKLSVNVDLTSNPVSGPIPYTGPGTIFIVSSAGNSSNTCVDATSITATAGVRVLGTHVDDTATVSKSEFQDVPLSTGAGAETTVLVGLCASIRRIGSGAGTCTCGSGS